jgi:curli biogenesis system outer membrane secretion channel CsgG
VVLIRGMRIALLALAACASSPKAPAETAPSIVEAMAQLAKQLEPKAPMRLAVFPFPERSAGSTLLGEYVMDKLLVSFGSSANVTLVERSKLEAIRAEQNFSGEGYTADETAVSIGNMLGAEGVVVGTLTDLGGQWEIAARVLGTEDAGVKKVGEARFASSGLPPGLAGVAAKSTSAKTPADDARTSALFSEDFGGVEEGLVPAGWVTDDGVAVVLKGKSKCLGHLKDQDHQIRTTEIPWSDDFLIEVDATVHNWVKISALGLDAMFGAPFGAVGLTNATEIWHTFDPYWGKRVLLGFDKKGPVLRLTVDGKQLLLSRLPQPPPAASAPLGIQFGSNRDQCIHRVRAIKR